LSTGVELKLGGKLFVWEVPDAEEILGVAEIVERIAAHMSRNISFYASLIASCMEYKGYRREEVHRIAARASSGEYTLEEFIAKLEEIFPKRGKVLRLLLLSKVDAEELTRNIRELHVMLLSEVVVAKKLAASLKEMHRRALLILFLLTASSMGLFKMKTVLAGISFLSIAPSVPWHVLAIITALNIMVLSRLCQLNIIKSLLATALGAAAGYMLFWVVL